MTDLDVNLEVSDGEDDIQVQGLLGIDFLRLFDISIHVRQGYIEVE